MKTITIRSIPHALQRYSTVGDWIDKTDATHILVSELPDPVYEEAIALHEVVEKLLCDKSGISQESVDDFDKKFEEERLQGKWNKEDPGDDPRAPYHIQHGFATSVERMYLAACGKNWKKYEDEVNAL